MQQLPICVPSDPFVFGSGIKVCDASRNEVVKIQLYPTTPLSVTPGSTVNAVGLGIVCRVVPQLDYDYSCNPKSSKVGGTDQPNYSLSSPSLPVPNSLDLPFFVVDLPYVYCPFDCELWVCGGDDTYIYQINMGVAILRRRAMAGDRRTNTLTFYVGSSPAGFNVPKGATGIFSPNPVNVGLTTCPANLDIFTTPESSKPLGLSCYTVVVPQVSGPLGFIIEM